MAEWQGHLCWDGTMARILSQGIKFVASDKPVVEGLDYDLLFFEPETLNFFKIVRKVDPTTGVNQEFNFVLTPEECAKIEKWCHDFKDVEDYPVWAYDPDQRLYVNEIPKSEALRLGYPYTLVAGRPDHPASKYFPAGGGLPERWIKLKAVIRSDGSLQLDPAYLCDQCVIGYTAEEWERVEHPKSYYEKWNFKTEKWEDPRTLEQVLYDAERDIQNNFDTRYWKKVGTFTPQYQMSTWYWQVQEAKAILTHLADKKELTAEWEKENCPFLSTFLEKRTDKNKPTLKELAEDVLKNHKEYLIACAEVAADLWSYKERMKSATTNEELDELKKEVAKNTQELYAENTGQIYIPKRQEGVKPRMIYTPEDSSSDKVTADLLRARVGIQ